jgi:hypothetical protein
MTHSVLYWSDSYYFHILFYIDLILIISTFCFILIWFLLFPHSVLPYIDLILIISTFCFILIWFLLFPHSVLYWSDSYYFHILFYIDLILIISTFCFILIWFLLFPHSVFKTECGNNLILIITIILQTKENESLPHPTFSEFAQKIASMNPRPKLYYINLDIKNCYDNLDAADLLRTVTDKLKVSNHGIKRRLLDSL